MSRNATTTTTTTTNGTIHSINSVDDYTGIETVRHSILSTSSKAKPTVETDDTSPDDDSLLTSGNNNNSHAPNDVIGNNNNKEQLRNATRQLRDEWRALWRAGRLITDRTELLAVYPSDDDDDTDAVVVVERDVTTTTTTTRNDEKVNNHHNHQEPTSKPARRKRGGFADLLFLYTDRLMAILSDEHDDSTHANESTGQTMDIVSWLEDNYGRSETHDLQYENFQLWDESTKLIKLKHFLEWFRSQFPYFYDRCDSCGASMKEDLAKAAATNAASDPSTTTSLDDTTTSGVTNETDHPLVPDNSDNAAVDDTILVVHSDERTPEEAVNTNDAADTESEHQTFVGYVYPNRTELVGKASRTELYQCHECASFTRFPRYNAAQFVMSQKRGRCGEYSMLLYRFIRALHHECRWVVDWADHVWVELLLLDNNDSNTSITNPSRPRWIHLDPCEAAVNENYIYQGWGKKQNYIVGLYLPTILNMNASLQHLSDHQLDLTNNRTLTTSTNISYIEDITHSYTNEEWSDICQSRDESETHIQASIVKATQELQNKLLEYYNFTTTTTAATSNATNNNYR